MQKVDKSSTTYDLNDRTKLRVTNLPDESGFSTTVALTHRLKIFRPLEFRNPKEVSDFFAGLDYEEEQQTLAFQESPTERLIGLQVRHDILELFRQVEADKITADDAIEVVDGLVGEWIGADEDNTYPFPANWDTNQRKNWIHSRNHHRRQLRSEYKG